MSSYHYAKIAPRGNSGWRTCRGQKTNINMGRLLDNYLAALNNVLGRYGSWFGIAELPRKLGGKGTLRICSVGGRRHYRSEKQRV